jgi:hypothetical protein
MLEQIMDKRNQRWTISIIGDFISRTLMVDPRLMSRKLMMAKAIYHVKVRDDLPDYILFTKATIFIGLIIFFSLTCMLKNCLDGQPHRAHSTSILNYFLHYNFKIWTFGTRTFVTFETPNLHLP